MVGRRLPEPTPRCETSPPTGHCRRQYPERDRLLLRTPWGSAKEVPMFQMIDEEKPTTSARDLLVKIGLFIVGLAALGGIVYLFAFADKVK